MAGPGQEGGEIAKICNLRPWLRFPESQNGTNPVVNAQSKCPSSLVLFFLVVMLILFFSEETSSLHVEPKRLSHFSAPRWGRICVGTKRKRKRKGGRQWKRAAGEDDSALFYMDVFCSSLCFSYLTLSVLPHPCPRPNREKKKPLPSFHTFTSHLLTSNRERKLKKAELNTNC